MKLLILTSLLGVALAQPTYEPISLDYHESVGIPAAARLKAAEEAMDFSGSRIIGGSAAPLGAHPYMGGLVITLADWRVSVCGSSLLSNTRAITAAHCWFDGVQNATEFVVVLGSTTVFSGGTRVATSDVEIHENFTLINVRNDIAIIRLPWVNYNNNIQNIALPSGPLLNQDFTGWWANAAGYGLQGQGATLNQNQQLHHVFLLVISNETCRARFAPNVVIHSTLCTNGDVAGICSSDSGGPLAVTSGGRFVLIGVASFGATTCDVGAPSGFARVTAFVDWIQARL